MKGMRGTFAEAMANAPCVLFIDELDAFGSRDRAPDHNSAWTDNVVAGLLECIDGFEQLEGVIVVAATNHPQKIDPAIRRAGRFDTTLRLEALTPDLLPQALRWHCGKDLPGADYLGLGRLLQEATGAEVAAIIRAARAKARAAHRPLAVEDLTTVIADHRPPLPQDLRRRVAIHEAGHAVAAIGTRCAEVISISIGPTGGKVEHRPVRGSMTADELEAALTFKLAGRAAERLIYGNASAGSGGSADSDLAQATELAVAMEAAYGQGQALVWLGSPETALRHLRYDRQLQHRVDLRLKAAEVRALRLLQANRDIALAVAKMLLEVQHISGPPLSQILAAVMPEGSAGVRPADKGEPDVGFEPREDRMEDIAQDACKVTG
ncbi:AAA family ATPase [Stagnihabitans tardus]|uniref:AAA family ATPase n=1 Tax=Stagnihabitans tardus TaxID=2699202 RepID=A0AAE4YBH5_9RHOB|nr:AAA family ATPase [Stagnihabitans tardus]NBZ89637.1 AAA family ATPase [Stagnihabitans tardus]